ncbi:RHS repeat-associated core domain-containing protein [Paenibacillus koleovorans]|uniref:RHS repeat-associated core domain-containing protein n=1 Tax=Paenibacillus koleovorans TaxID=121608 RepID=UPI001FEC4F47
MEQPFRYSGEYWDNATSLQYLRARWYDPSIARFMGEDTHEGRISNPLSLNLYTYLENNPLIYKDPTGKYKDSDDETLRELVKPFEERSNKGDKTAEQDADALRVSYYHLNGTSLPDDVKYRDKGLPT